MVRFPRNKLCYQPGIIFETSKKCEKFLKLLEEINKHQIKLVNPIETIEWNYKKTYLRDLEKIGVPIIDTLWVKKNQLGTVASLIKKKEWEKMVIKPVISEEDYMHRCFMQMIWKRS